MKKIKLSNMNKYILVDDDDFNLSIFLWRGQVMGNTVYAVRNGRKSQGESRKEIRIHNMIMKPGAGLEVDHIDRNGLNNQKNNLRICTHHQNMYNRGGINKTSKYKGVSWHNGNKMWQASIGYEGKTHHLGYSRDELAMAKKYDEASKKFFGKYAVLNFG